MKDNYQNLACFKAYDIRGMIPDQLDNKLSYEIARAYAKYFAPKKVIVGRDVRLESPMLAESVIKGFTDHGVDVIDIGVCGTEEVYFHSFIMENQGVDGGLMITASHNPKGYNGIKMVGKGASPIYETNGLNHIKDIILENLSNRAFEADLSTQFTDIDKNEYLGKITSNPDKTSYINYLLKFLDTSTLKPLKILVNPGNGPAGSIIKLLESKLPFEFVYMFDTPDGTFPNGVPNPMLIENQKVTADAVVSHGADLGLAWDGDFDRCFFFDEKGNFIEGYYIVGLISEMLLKNKTNRENDQETIIHDPRLVWNTLDIARKYNSKAIQSRCGHSYIKEKMRSENAIYGGEMSAHHYFRDFGFCDSGMIPWLLVAQLMCMEDTPLSSMIDNRIKTYPCSGEINFRINASPQIVLDRILDFYKDKNPSIDYTDGIGVEMDDWRFNVRMSNTEPLLRLNAESKGSTEILEKGIQEIKNILENFVN